MSSLDCSNNKLAILDVSKTTKIRSLNCKNNDLKSITFHAASSKLSDVDCSYNNLVMLEKGKPIDNLSCYGNTYRVELAEDGTFDMNSLKQANEKFRVASVVSDHATDITGAIFDATIASDGTVSHWKGILKWDGKSDRITYRYKVNQYQSATYTLLLDYSKVKVSDKKTENKEDDKLSSATNPSQGITSTADNTSESVTQKDDKVNAPVKVSGLKLKNKKSKTVKVSFSKIKDAAGYEVVIAQNRSFTKKKKTIVLRSGKTVCAVFKRLKKKKTYYVKVRAYKKYAGKKLYGPYSKVKSIKVKK